MDSFYSNNNNKSTYERDTMTNIEIVQRVVDGLSNYSHNGSTVKEICLYLRGLSSSIVNKRTVNEVLHYLLKQKILDYKLIEGKMRWFKIPLKTEELTYGLITPKPKENVHILKDNGKKLNDNETLTEEVLIEIAKSISLAEAEQKIKKEEKPVSKMPIPSLKEIEQELKYFSTDEEMLLQPFIENHDVVPGLPLGKAPFTFEEVLFWWSKLSGLKLSGKSIIFGSTLCVVKDSKFVALFQERPDKKYNFPGGARELFETPQDTLTRELKEEGVKLTNVKIEGNKIPALISIANYPATKQIAMNWMWMVRLEDVIMPDKPIKWIDPSNYLYTDKDYAWVTRVMEDISCHGWAFYLNAVKTTAICHHEIHDGINSVHRFSAQVPWNNMKF